MGPEGEELLAVGNGQIAERGAARVVRHAGERGGGQRERRIPGCDQVGDVPGGDRRCHGRGFFLVESALVVSGGAGGLGSSCTPLARPVTAHRSTLSPFRRQSMTMPREELREGPTESCWLARCVKERAAPRAMTRFSLVLDVPVESGTWVQRAVSESPANQSVSAVPVESRLGDSFFEVEW